MTSQEKPDAREIRQHLDALKKAPWLGSDRSWWPNYVFHCTDIRNAVKILKTGELLSRAELSSQQFTDIASPEIIGQTDERWKDYVRLYFRPRTPTQYDNEGFRPKSKLVLGAHCPVPIYFFFNAKSVISHKETLFSNGNLGAPGAIGMRTAEQFKQLPFEKIYHNVAFSPEQRSEIIYHRNAEVIFPKRLDLGALELIFCRSEAEYETLIFLLPPSIKNRWVGKIGLGIKQNLFFRTWTFVEKVELNRTRAVFHFNKGSETPGPFLARVEVIEAGTNLQYKKEKDQFIAEDALTLSLPSLANSEDYLIRLFLDDGLAYANRYQEERLPF